MKTRLNLERLETREVPAGVVTLTATAAGLTLTGDGDVAGNDVLVRPLAGNHFVISGRNGTTIKAGALVAANVESPAIAGFSFANKGTTKLTVNFGVGPDRFE